MRRAGPVGAREPGLSVRIAEAAYPAVFPHGLEFNPPAHGTWNIVHVGMLVPESRQIYVCAENCMRGVILTAAEMGASDRFSCVILREEDLLDGTVEEVTLEGVTDVLRKLPELPPAVLLFTVCTHRFLGCDLDHLYAKLEERFPDVDFIRCTMEPITQKEGPSPDARLRRSMLEPFRPCPPDARRAAVLGGDFALEEDCELRSMLGCAGMTLSEIQDMKTYREYLRMAEASLMISVFPRAAWGVEAAARRLGRRYLHLPASFSYEEIRGQLDALGQILGVRPPDARAEAARCDARAAQVLTRIGQTPILIDYAAHPRPLGLARYLLERGFRVEAVYLDAVAPEEHDDFLYLKDRFGPLELRSVIRPGGRTAKRGRAEKVLAIGQIAAWFASTSHFVNMVEGGGLHGWSGIRRMLDLMEEAFDVEKDTRDLIPRKGLGCESCK